MADKLESELMAWSKIFTNIEVLFDQVFKALDEVDKNLKTLPAKVSAIQDRICKDNACADQAVKNFIQNGKSLALACCRADSGRQVQWLTMHSDECC